MAYNRALGEGISRDPIEEMGGESLYAFVANNSIGLIDGDGRYAVRLVKEPSIDPCGGWNDARWLSIIPLREFAVWLVQKITWKQRWHKDCKMDQNHFIKTDDVHFEAKRIQAGSSKQAAFITDVDSVPSHGDGFGYQSITGEGKLFDLRSHPEIETQIGAWPLHPLSRDMRFTKEPVPWWDSLTALDSGNRYSYRDWSCCCSLVEGPFVHTP